MNKIIDAIYDTGHCTAPDGTTFSVFPEAIKRAEGEALYKLTRDLDARKTLEVGMAWGLSSLFMCQAHLDAHHASPAHTVIDPFQVSGFRSTALHHLTSAGLRHYVNFIEESSHIALPRLVTSGEQFDLIFIDGAHLFDPALVDFFFADQLIPVGGHLVFDDLWMPAVRKVLGFVLTNRAYRIAEERLPPLGRMADARARNRDYQLKKKKSGKSDQGTKSEATFHLYRNINWTILQKTAEDKRNWEHFVKF